MARTAASPGAEQAGGTSPLFRSGPRGSWDAARAQPLDRLIDRVNQSSMERRLAVARLLAALALLLAMRLGGGPYHPPEVIRLLVAYGGYAAGILVLTWWFPFHAAAAAGLIHILDFGWATGLTAISGGPSSHTFMLFLLVLAASAYRWSLRGSLITGAAILLIASAEALGAAKEYFPWPFELDTFVELTASVVVFAVLFGLLSERLHALGAHAVMLGEILERVRRAGGVGGAVHETLEQILAVFGADEVLVAAREFDGQTVVLWRAQRQADRGILAERNEIGGTAHDALTFAAPGGATTWELRCSPSGAAADVIILTADGRLAPESAAGLPALPGVSSCRSLTVTVIDAPGLWSGRLFLVNADRPRERALRLALLQKLVAQLTPALASAYLMRRLRSRAEAVERARLGHELHDGLVQTLATLELRLEAAARGVSAYDRALSTELQNIRHALRADLVNVREMVERLRPVEIEAANFPGELRDRIERFSTTSGIRGELVWSADAGQLTRRQRQEVLRIVQEALVNVRRHSGATRAIVRVAADLSDWEVVIEDNGRGFGFSGRRTHAELKERGEGPRAIRERVESLAGTLELESSPAGARLEVVFPRMRT